MVDLDQFAAVQGKLEERRLETARRALEREECRLKREEQQRCEEKTEEEQCRQEDLEKSVA